MHAVLLDRGECSGRARTRSPAVEIGGLGEEPPLGRRECVSHQFLRNYRPRIVLVVGDRVPLLRFPERAGGDHRRPHSFQRAPAVRPHRVCLAFQRRPPDPWTRGRPDEPLDLELRRMPSIAPHGMRPGTVGKRFAWRPRGHCRVFEARPRTTGIPAWHDGSGTCTERLAAHRLDWTQRIGWETDEVLDHRVSLRLRPDERAERGRVAAFPIGQRLASRDASVTPRGDFTCATGSPTMKMRRGAPLEAWAKRSSWEATAHVGGRRRPPALRLAPAHGRWHPRRG